MIILNKTLRIKCVGSCTLFPGANTVDDETWRATRAGHSIEDWFEPSLKFPEGECVEVATGDSIADMPPAKAARMVLECADPALRARWRKNETRPLVLKAFEQLDEELAQREKANAEKTAARKARG